MNKSTDSVLSVADTHEHDTHEHDTHHKSHVHKNLTFSKVMLTTIVLVLGTTLFGMITSGTFKNYLQPYFKPILLAADVVLVLLAVWKLHATSEEAENNIPAKHHGHQHALPRVGALLMIPALLFMLAAPAALGESAATNTSVKRITAMHTDFTPFPDNKINDTTVMEISDRFTLGTPKDLTHKKVKFTGFIAKPKDLPSDVWTVNRFRIFCCAADATLFNVAIKGWEKPDGNGWVQVEGEIFPDVNGEIAVVVPSDVTPIPEPEDPYL